MDYLGTDRFALWLSIMALTQILAFSDLGVGASLMTLLPSAIGRDDWALARKCISTATWKLVTLAGWGLGLFVVVRSLVPWSRLLGLSDAAMATEMESAVAAMIICFLLNLPFTVASRVQAGLQDSGVSLWGVASGALGLIGIAIGITQKCSLLGLVLLSMGLPILAAMLNTAWVLWFRYPMLQLRWSDVDRQVASTLTSTGLLFCTAQFATAISLGSDPIIVNHVLGPAAAVQHSLATRLFNPLTMVLGLALTPLWPAYAEAYARGQHDWIRRVLSKSLLTAAAALVLPGILLVIIGPALLEIWVPGQPAPSLGLLVSIGVHTLLTGYGNAVAMFLNGTSRLHIQAVTTCALALVSVALKLSLGRLGLEQFAWAGSIAQFACVAVPASTYIYRECFRDAVIVPVRPAEA
jgi:O-antigen/teichoic acid export membrane protein